MSLQLYLSINCLNSDYINERTEVSQQKMKELMEDLIKQM